MIQGLTDLEHQAIRQAGELWNTLCRVVDDGQTCSADLAELAGHVHAIQHAVMANAAARAHPDLYRVLGNTIQPQPRHWGGSGGMPHDVPDMRSIKVTDVPSKVTCRVCVDALHEGHR